MSKLGQLWDSLLDTWEEGSQWLADSQVDEEGAATKEEDIDVMSSIYKWEGGYSEVKTDSGNYTTSGKLVGTNKGISAKTLESYIGREPTVDDMKNLDQETISKIYKEEFYERYKIAKLPNELQEVAMHALVTGGPKTIKYLQELAGTDQDMLIGDKTLEGLKNKGITAEQLKNKVLSEYKNFAGWKDSGNGWTNRFNDVSR
jgi:lysozyme family protein